MSSAGQLSERPAEAARQADINPLDLDEQRLAGHAERVSELSGVERTDEGAGEGLRA